MNLVGIVQVYNEVERGNLHRCLQNMQRYCDAIVVYDDGSTDGSAEVARGYTDEVIEGGVNDFANETAHRNLMLQRAIAMGADYVVWLDADEVFDYNATGWGLRSLCASGLSYRFEEVTLWRSWHWRRLDYLGWGWFTRLWKVEPGMEILERRGLHRQLFPDGLTVERAPHKVLHFGYATKEAIERRWRERTRHGVPVEVRRLGLDERAMELERVSPTLFPAGIDVPPDEPPPTPIRYAEDIMAEAGL